MFKEYLRDKQKRSQLRGAIPVVLVVALVGIYLLVSSHAATPYGSTNASQGTLAGGASSQADSTASNGQKVVFGRAIPTDGGVALDFSSPGAPFAASSFWNTLLPASIPANLNSTDYVNEITNQVCYGYTTFSTDPTVCPATNGNTSALNIANWSAPLYVVPAGQATTNVGLGAGCNNSTAFTAARTNVPIPADAHGAGETNGNADTDQEVQIYQPSSDSEWEFWHFQKDTSGNWTACWGGVIHPVSQSNGIFPSDTGATATSLPLLGGVPRVSEFQAGQINHVINLSLGENFYKTPLVPVTPPATQPPCTANPPNCTVPANVTDPTRVAYSWPATRNDGRNASTLAIPEGQRFRIDPTFNLAQYNSTLVANGQKALTPMAMAIAVAAQKYGFVVDDTSYSVSIRMPDPTTYAVASLPNPYTTGPGVGGVGNQGLFEGVTQNLIMKNFPWGELQALPFNYGQPGS